MKLFINPTNIHKMNKIALDELIIHMGIQRVHNIGEADVIYSAGQPMNTEQFPNKKYIFGPHFSVFPNPQARSISGRYNNAVYIQPSQPSVDTWVGEFSFNNIPVKAFPFPVNMDRYKPSDSKKDTALIYFKRRREDELNLVIDILGKHGYKYELIRYGSYQEAQYQSLLNRSKFVFCLGRHESQGFAIQSALAKDIPMIVWDVRLRKQEVGFEKKYLNVKSPVTTVPYWDSRCGEKFFDADNLEKTFDKFILNLDTYKPREFMQETVSVEACANNFLTLVKSIGK